MLTCPPISLAKVLPVPEQMLMLIMTGEINSCTADNQGSETGFLNLTGLLISCVCVCVCTHVIFSYNQTVTVLQLSFILSTDLSRVFGLYLQAKILEVFHREYLSIINLKSKHGVCMRACNIT